MVFEAEAKIMANEYLKRTCMLEFPIKFARLVSAHSNDPRDGYFEDDRWEIYYDTSHSSEIDMDPACFMLAINCRTKEIEIPDSM